MARFIFTPAAVTIDGLVGRVTFHTRSAGGQRIYDLVRVDGSDIPTIGGGIPNGIIPSDALTGLTGTFAGPDGLDSLWMSRNGGTRTQIFAVRQSADVVYTTQYQILYAGTTAPSGAVTANWPTNSLAVNTTAGAIRLWNGTAFVPSF